MKDYFQSNVVKDPGTAAAGTVSSGGDAATHNTGGRWHKTFVEGMMTAPTTTSDKTGDNGTAAAASRRLSLNGNETLSRIFGGGAISHSQKTMIAGNIGKMAPESQSNCKEFNRQFNES